MIRPRIGIDLGGTKIEIVALAPDGQVLIRDRTSTPRSYPGTLDAIEELVACVEAEVGSASVGLGIPGAISPATGLVKNANSTWLIGHPLDLDLQERLERPVRVTNDANCFALSEAADGAGAGAAVVFGVILGTGVGGGLVVDGRVVDGPQRIGGEWGHNPLPWPKDEERPGPECYCGRRGCMETFVSGPGMEADHARVTGEQLDSERIGGAAEAGDGDAIATIGR